MSDIFVFSRSFFAKIFATRSLSSMWLICLVAAIAGFGIGGSFAYAGDSIVHKIAPYIKQDYVSKAKKPDVDVDHIVSETKSETPLVNKLKSVADDGDIPIHAGQKTPVDLLRLTPDKSEFIPMPRPISRVIVGNEAHLSVVPDGDSAVVLIGRAPGSTYFTVLDDKGDVVYERHVIVAAPEENYIRIRRSCALSDGGQPCEPMSVYYCPDMCHEVSVRSSVRDQPLSPVTTKNISPRQVVAPESAVENNAPANISVDDVVNADTDSESEGDLGTINGATN
jgi:hypothetical protein